LHAFPPFDSVSCIVFGITPDREQEKDVPFVALCMTHPKREGFTHRGIQRHSSFAEVDQLEKFAGGCLNEAGLVEV